MYTYATYQIFFDDRIFKNISASSNTLSRAISSFNPALELSGDKNSSSDPGVARTIHPGSVARNTLLIFTTQVFTRVIGLVTSVLLANYLGTSQFGIYNYAFALTALFVPICDLGMDTHILRTISRGPTAGVARELETVLGGKLLLTTVDFLLVIAVSASLDPFGSQSFIIIIFAAAVTFLRSYWTTFSSFFRAINRVNYDILTFSAIRMAEFGMIAIALIMKRSMLELLSGFAIINFVGIMVTFWIVDTRFLGIRFRFNLKMLLRTLRPSIPFATTAIFVTLYFNIDTVLVKLIVGDSAAGIYRAAYNLVIPLLMVSSSATAAIFPYVSQNRDQKIDQVRRLLQKFNSYLLMIALPIAVMVSFLAPEIISFLFKPAFSAASTSLLIVIWFLPVAYLTNLYGNVLGAMDHQRYVMKVSAVNVLFNISANLVLIPLYAQNGAAITTVLTEILGLSLLYIRLKGLIGHIMSPDRIFKSLLSASFTIPFLILDIGLHLFLRIGIAAALYAGGLFLLKAVSVSEIKQLFDMVRGKNGIK